MEVWNLIFKVAMGIALVSLILTIREWIKDLNSDEFDDWN